MSWNSIPRRTNYERGRLWVWPQTLGGTMILLAAVYMYITGGPLVRDAARPRSNCSRRGLGMGQQTSASRGPLADTALELDSSPEFASDDGSLCLGTTSVSLTGDKPRPHTATTDPEPAEAVGAGRCTKHSSSYITLRQPCCLGFRN